jgi:hypothetical protein
MPPSRFRGRCQSVKAAVEVSKPRSRCQRRGRSVKAAVEVSKPPSRCFKAAVEVSRLLSRCRSRRRGASRPLSKLGLLSGLRPLWRCRIINHESIHNCNCMQPV